MRHRHGSIARWVVGGVRDGGREERRKDGGREKGRFGQSTYVFVVCGAHQVSSLYTHSVLPLSLPSSPSPSLPPSLPPLLSSLLFPSPQTSEMASLQVQLKSLAHEHEKEIRKKDSEVHVHVLTVYRTCAYTTCTCTCTCTIHNEHFLQCLYMYMYMYMYMYVHMQSLHVNQSSKPHSLPSSLLPLPPPSHTHFFPFFTSFFLVQCTCACT